MIRHTFSIVNGIGEKLEKRIWREGILTWPEFVSSIGPEFISPERKGLMDETLEEAGRALDEHDSAYFCGAMRRTEHWRLFEDFGNECVCLDIETNGLAPGFGGYATVVGLYDGHDYRCLIRGRDLTEKNLMDALSDYKLLITFFGGSFDVPFLLKCFRGLKINMPHFDLCSGAKRLGMKGGLKKIEPQFGIHRIAEVEGMDGYAAVLLWARARKGDEEALEKLVLYNKEDTVNLHPMARKIYEGLKESTGIYEYIARA